ncbi:hypothetical protein BH20ACT8_BH20ACT8_07270 [soil metagenome]
MDRRRWTTISGLAALAGGLAWIAKLAVIVAINGAQTDTGAAGVAFLLGAATGAANVEPDYLRAEAGVLVTALLATAWGLGRAVTASRRRPIVPN